jgi:hypothetical protein
MMIADRVLTVLNTDGQGQTFGEVFDRIRLGSRTTIRTCLARLVVEGKAIKAASGAPGTIEGATRYWRAE